MSETSARRSAALPFAAIGVGCIVAGGLVAAVTAPAPTEHGTWAAAYLVLVAGVAQVALGVGQALIATRAPSPRTVLAQVIAWNLSSVAVVAGTFADLTTLVYAGGALLVAALLLLLRSVHDSAVPRWQLAAFWLLAVVLLVSIPIGLVLARIRSG